ncbi:MAG: hypothetical protein ABI425_01475 [Patescibacteria group bacterium]
MTFEELNSKTVAIRAHKISYDFFDRTLELIVTPEYGIKDEVKGRKFSLHFEGCIFLSTKGLINHSESGVEFVSWGKFKDKNKTIELVSIPSSMQGIEDFGTKLGDDINNYYSYFFENAFGDNTYVTCSKVIVREL